MTWTPPQVIVGVIAIIVTLAWAVSLVYVVVAGKPVSDDLHAFLAVVGGVLIGLFARPGGRNE